MSRDKPARPPRSTRRQLLRGALQAGALAVVAGTVGCGSAIRRTPNQAYLRLPEAPAGRAVLGIHKHDSADSLCQEAVAQLDNLAWLSEGDSVFLKVACNSGYEHPAVTYPKAVEAMVQLLRARGAGKIYVGDQAGVEHVRLTAGDRLSRTEVMMAQNGLLDAIARSGATLHCFDDQGWDGYFEAKLDFAHHWERPPLLPKILEQVDHIVYLPRLSAHALAGYTCGIKSAVGWLRDDSRLLLHQRGASFFEKFAEINHVPAIRDKLRLVLTITPQALLNVGPDIGAVHDLGGNLVLASNSLVQHDAIAAALVPWLDRHDTSVFDLYRPYPTDIDHWNRDFVEEIWGAEAIEAYQPMLGYRLGRHLALDACISHLSVLQGQRASHTDLHLSGDALPDGLAEYLANYSGRPFRVVRG